MQSLILVAALALCLGLVYAQSPACVGGILMAQFADSNISITATGPTDYIMGGCNDPNITLRVGFSYMFMWNLTFHPFGIYNSTGGLIAGNTTMGPIMWTPSMADLQMQGFWYRCGRHPAMMGYIFILPPANIPAPINGNVTAHLWATSAACPTNPTFTFIGPRFCDPTTMGFAVQCDNVSGTVMPVSYACGNCMEMAPVCDVLPQGMWPPNGFCVPNSGTTSGIFTCGRPVMTPVTIIGADTLVTPVGGITPVVAGTPVSPVVAGTPVSPVMAGTPVPTPVTPPPPSPPVASKKVSSSRVALAGVAMLVAVAALF